MTHSVEIVGGPQDGQVVTVDDACTTLRVEHPSVVEGAVDMPLVKTPRGWRVYWPMAGASE